MIRLIVLAGLVFSAYKLGEAKSRLEEFDFFVTKIDANGNLLYLQINNGVVNFTIDMNAATTFNYWDASKIKNLLKKYSPETVLKLETVSNFITAQTAV